jgi:hypothetical protein
MKYDSINSSSSDYRKHLDATMGWLVRSQLPNGGFAASYSCFRGWSLAYPETTGYIIETMLKYAHLNSQEDWSGIVNRAGEWLLSIQLPEGGFPGGYGISKTPRVFNTGMILFGLSSLYKTTNDGRFKDAGLQTLAWLSNIQEKDGSWIIASLDNRPHVYHSRVAWGMLEMANTLNMLDKYQPTIERANDWVLLQQDDDGWFRENDLIPGLPPLTHNIAYTIRGLMECGLYLKNDRWLSAAIRAAQAVYQDWYISGRLASGYWSGWRRGPSFRCVTGDAQFGGIWFRLWQITGEKHWLNASRGIAEQVAQVQYLNHFLPGVKGGIPGAWPIWERYLRFSYPNWAAKFFADLMLFLLLDE